MQKIIVFSLIIAVSVVFSASLHPVKAQVNGNVSSDSCVPDENNKIPYSCLAGSNVNNVNNAKSAFSVSDLNSWMIVPAMPAVPVIIVSDMPEIYSEGVKSTAVENVIVPLMKSFLQGGGLTGPKFVSDWKGLLNDVPLDMAKKYIDANLSAYARPEFSGILRPYFQDTFNSSQMGKELEPTLSSAELDSFSQDFTNGGWKTWLELTSNPQNHYYGTVGNSFALFDGEQEHQSNALEKSTVSGNGMLNPLKEMCVTSVGGQCVSWNYIETVPNKAIERVMDELRSASFEPLYSAQSWVAVILALFQNGFLWDIINGNIDWGSTLRNTLNSVVR